MFHILLFLLHRWFKETYFNLIRSSNRCSQMLFLFLMGLTVVRCTFPTRRGLEPLHRICDRYPRCPYHTIMVFTTGVKLPLWWCQDVSSGIMWGFLLFIPQINLHLHPHMWVSNRNCNNKKKRWGKTPVLPLRYVVGWTAESQMLLNNSQRTADQQRAD